MRPPDGPIDVAAFARGMHQVSMGIAGREAMLLRKALLLRGIAERIDVEAFRAAGQDPDAAAANLRRLDVDLAQRAGGWDGREGSPLPVEVSEGDLTGPWTPQRVEWAARGAENDIAALEADFGLAAEQLATAYGEVRRRLRAGTLPTSALVHMDSARDSLARVRRLAGRKA